jgi:hypothetical protein
LLRLERGADLLPIRLEITPVAGLHFGEAPHAGQKSETWFQHECPIIASSRIIKTLQLAKRRSQSEICLGKVWIELNGLGVFVHGSIHQLQFLQHIGPVNVRRGKIFLERNGPVVAGQRRIELAHTRERDAASVKCLGKRRVQFDGPIIAARRGLLPSQAVQHAAAIEMRLDVVASEPDRPVVTG